MGIREEILGYNTSELFKTGPSIEFKYKDISGQDVGNLTLHYIACNLEIITQTTREKATSISKELARMTFLSRLKDGYFFKRQLLREEEQTKKIFSDFLRKYGISPEEKCVLEYDEKTHKVKCQLENSGEEIEISFYTDEITFETANTISRHDYFNYYNGFSLTEYIEKRDNKILKIDLSMTSNFPSLEFWINQDCFYFNLSKKDNSPNYGNIKTEFIAKKIIDKIFAIKEPITSEKIEEILKTSSFEIKNYTPKILRRGINE